MFEKCPCGVGPSYLACCAPLHLGQREADAPEQLMRARYSAFARGDAAFLLRSWAAETRPAKLDDLAAREWLGLAIEDAPTPEGDQGRVRFSARFRQDGERGTLRETSRFVRRRGRWLYLDGALGREADGEIR